jgi:hypothetical protein
METLLDNEKATYKEAIPMGLKNNKTALLHK